VKITSREKRIIAIGVCVAVAVMIYYAATLLLPDRDSLTQDVTIKKRLLLKQRESLTREELFKKRIDQYRERLQKEMTLLLPGENPNVAGAELQKILKEFADQSGVEITQKNILPEKKVQDLLTKVSVRIDTNCNLEQLVQFMTAIENHEKYLKIEECMINGFRIQKRYEIRPSLTIAGYISARADTSKEKPATGG
jgi:type II secretory pathway component PulM